MKNISISGNCVETYGKNKCYFDNGYEEKCCKKWEHENILFLLSELKILARVFENSGNEKNNSREGVMGWNDGIYSPLWRGSRQQAEGRQGRRDATRHYGPTTTKRT